MGSGASAGTPGTQYFCHRCRSVVDDLAEGDVCPNCGGGFIEESPSATAIAQAARWLVHDEEDMGAASSTEARIARLLEDLHEHLAMVEGLHGSMARVMEAVDGEATPQLEPAPREVMDAIREVTLDHVVLNEMKQTPQCVICCSDFEVNGDGLSQLPGCGHLFHAACIRQWLDRAANCPICRCDLRQAVGVDRLALSTTSSGFLDSELPQFVDSLSSPPTPLGFRLGPGESIGARSLAVHTSSPPLVSLSRNLSPHGLRHRGDFAGNAGFTAAAAAAADRRYADFAEDQGVSAMLSSRGYADAARRPASVIGIHARNDRASPTSQFGFSSPGGLLQHDRSRRDRGSAVLVGAGSSISSLASHWPTQSAAASNPANGRPGSTAAEGRGALS